MLNFNKLIIVKFVPIFFLEKLLLSNDIKDYHFVSQGKTVIEGVDDKAEMLITDVRNSIYRRMNELIEKMFFFA